MPSVRQVAVKEGDVLLLVGTTKGAFLFRSDGARRRWEAGGPHFPGRAVYAMAFDGRAGRRRIWAGAHSMHWGAGLHASDDFGRTWTNPETAPIRFPEGAGVSLMQIWQIRPGRADDPATLYVRPHVNLFVGTEDIRFTGGLATPVRDGSEIAILPAVSGGRGSP